MPERLVAGERRAARGGPSRACDRCDRRRHSVLQSSRERTAAAALSGRGRASGREIKRGSSAAGESVSSASSGRASPSGAVWGAKLASDLQIADFSQRAPNFGTRYLASNRRLSSSTRPRPRVLPEEKGLARVVDALAAGLAGCVAHFAYVGGSLTANSGVSFTSVADALPPAPKLCRLVVFVVIVAVGRR